MGTARRQNGASTGKKSPGRRVTAGTPDPTRIYLSEIGISPLLTADEEKDLSRRALRGDEAARQRMIESNLRLVVKIARRYINRGLPNILLDWQGALVYRYLS